MVHKRMYISLLYNLPLVYSMDVFSEMFTFVQMYLIFESMHPLFPKFFMNIKFVLIKTFTLRICLYHISF